MKLACQDFVSKGDRVYELSRKSSANNSYGNTMYTINEKLYSSSSASQI